MNSSYWPKGDFLNRSLTGNGFGTIFRGMALSAGRRVLVPDIEACEAMAADLDAFRWSGVRAVQSTPLLARSGRLLPDKPRT